MGDLVVSLGSLAVWARSVARNSHPASAPFNPPTGRADHRRASMPWNPGWMSTLCGNPYAIAVACWPGSHHIGGPYE